MGLENQLLLIEGQKNLPLEAEDQFVVTVMIDGLVLPGLVGTEFTALVVENALAKIKTNVLHRCFLLYNLVVG